jgi:hypothetical protein
MVLIKFYFISLNSIHIKYTKCNFNQRLFEIFKLVVQEKRDFIHTLHQNHIS